MIVSIRKVKNATVVELEGNLILGEPVDQFRAQIHELLGGGAKRLAINLAHVRYLDSSGVGAIAAAHTSTRKSGGKCNFFGVPRHVMAIFEMVGLVSAINLSPDEAAALSTLPSVKMKA
jgi:anti-sigma B factor antagonist